jgi:hypothetical protein
MSDITFVIQEYEQAMYRFVQQVLAGFSAVDPLLGQMGRGSTAHNGPIRNVRGPSPIDQVMPPVEVESRIDHDSIRNTDIEDYTRMLHELATANIRVTKRQSLHDIGEVSEAVGTSIDAEGAPFSFDMVLDGLERISLEFDDEGNPLLPTLLMHPRMLDAIREFRPTPEQEGRQAEIIERKRREYHAQKRNRRLS